MMKITNNFWWHEFAPHGAGRDWLPQHKLMQLMLKILAENLQILRSYYSQSIFNVSSGVRSLVDYQRLKAAGYNPSTTSDHYCGQAIPLESGTSKFKKYGSFYTFSVGAADIVPSGISSMDLFSLAVDFDLKGKVNFGQIIYENNPASGSEWIHFGNDPGLFFQPEVVEFFQRKKYLTSIDGGKTYLVADKGLL